MNTTINLKVLYAHPKMDKIGWIIFEKGENIQRSIEIRQVSVINPSLPRPIREPAEKWFLVDGEHLISRTNLHKSILNHAEREGSIAPSFTAKGTIEAFWKELCKEFGSEAIGKFWSIFASHISVK